MRITKVSVHAESNERKASCGRDQPERGGRAGKNGGGCGRAGRKALANDELFAHRRSDGTAEAEPGWPAQMKGE